MTKGYEDEFPLLAKEGLYASPIPGDGNCLFSALSDQLFGSTDNQRTIRARTIDYMRANGPIFKSFLTVNPGGGIRRNPKRKNANCFATPLDASSASAEEVDRVFESHLSTMAKGGVYGDNMEIVAFAYAYNVHVKIYLQDYAYMVAPQGDQLPRHTCHIAYHTWEHYSSVRNIDGPFNGEPKVDPKQLYSDRDPIASSPPIPTTSLADWQITVVENSLPHAVDRATVIQTLEQFRGNVNNAVDKLLSASEERRGSSASAKSSSVERDIDSSDDYGSGPNKKQDRRISRASKAVRRNRAEGQRSNDLAAKLDTFGDSLESLVQGTNDGGLIKPQRRSWDLPADSDDDDDDGPIPPLKDGTTSESSEYSESTRPGPTIKLNLKPSIPAKKPLQKRLTSARDLKQMKKYDQKRAAKERKQALASPKKSLAEVPPVIKSASDPSMSTAIRTLYI